jgi:predicted O-methyltransferase YrrM
MASILADLTVEYLSSIEPPADALVEEMEAHARRESIPIAAREVATLQRVLAIAMDADRVLEFGTAIGYSAIQVARTGCEVVTMEVDEERIEAARTYAERDGVADRLEIHDRPALEALEDVEGPFDLAFLDAVKTEYPRYLERALPMLRTGGVVIVDNALWGGDVPEAHAIGGADADVAPIGDPSDAVPDEDPDAGAETSPSSATEALLAFNDAFVHHPALEAVVTPIDDGIGIGVKRP